MAFAKLLLCNTISWHLKKLFTDVCFWCFPWDKLTILLMLSLYRYTDRGSACCIIFAAVLCRHDPAHRRNRTFSDLVFWRVSYTYHWSSKPARASVALCIDMVTTTMLYLAFSAVPWHAVYSLFTMVAITVVCNILTTWQIARYSHPPVTHLFLFDSHNLISMPYRPPP